MPCGGARPGAGRKPKADRKQNMTFRLSPEAIEAARACREKGINLSEQIEALIRSLVE